MAYSIDTYIGDGSNRIFSFTKPYIRKDDVTVSVNGLPVAFTWITDSSVQLATAPALGATVTIKRVTTLLSKEVDFVDGSSLTEHDLDLSMDQLIFSMQESHDTVESTLRRDVEGSLQWNAQGYRIENVASPVNSHDLVNKLWAETAMSSSLAQATAARDAAELAKTNAELYAASADASKTSAAASASSASTSATNAATSASSASTSASLAAAAKVGAETAATNAAASYDLFDDRYLGVKTADPTTDNDGNSLLVGALYWNSTVGEMRAWSGTNWKVTYTPAHEFASPSENAAGAIEGKVVDPLGIREALNAIGECPIYACRAWVNFAGASSPIYMRGSGNVSSIIDNGVGDYTIVFEVPLPDADFAISVSSSHDPDGAGSHAHVVLGYFSKTSIRIRVLSDTSSLTKLEDSPITSVAIFR